MNRAMKCLSKREVFQILMRRMNHIAYQLPRNLSEEILNLKGALENLEYFPDDIRTDRDYPEE